MQKFQMVTKKATLASRTLKQFQNVFLQKNKSLPTIKTNKANHSYMSHTNASSMFTQTQQSNFWVNKSVAKRRSKAGTHLNLFSRHRKSRSMFKPSNNQQKFSQTASYFTKVCNYNPVEDKKKKGKVMRAFFVNEVKSLEKWKMTMHDKDIIQNFGPYHHSNNSSVKKQKNEVGFYDSGAKMIDLMATVFEKSEDEDEIIKASTIQPNKDGHYTLKNASMVISAHDHNKKIIENVIKKKLRRAKINFNESNPHQLKQQIKVFTQDLTNNFDHLRPYYQSKSNFTSECKQLLRTVLEDKNFKMRLALNENKNKIDRINARNNFFEKFKRLQSEINFCDDKIISKDSLKEKEVRKLAEQIERSEKFKKVAIVEIKQLRKDLEVLPEVKARLILKGLSKFREEVEVLTLKIRKKTHRLEYLEYEFDRKVRYEGMEYKNMEKNIKNFDKDMDYIQQVKEGYKYELGVYLKELMEGNLDADYYEKSIIDYKIMMRKVKFINYDFQVWEGFDITDLNYIKDITKLRFQLDCLEGTSRNKKRRRSRVLNAGEILAFEEQNKQNNHFSLIKKLQIPNVQTVIEKLKKMNYKKKYTSFGENSASRVSRKTGSNSKSMSGIKLKKRSSSSKSRSKIERKKGAFIFPALEIRKTIEIIDKKQTDKLHMEIQNKKRKVPGFFEKKLAMLYGYAAMEEIVGKYKLLNKIQVLVN